jgi:hypothetical protein
METVKFVLVCTHMTVQCGYTPCATVLEPPGPAMEVNRRFTDFRVSSTRLDVPQLVSSMETVVSIYPWSLWR